MNTRRKQVETEMISLDIRWQDNSHALTLMGWQHIVCCYGKSLKYEKNSSALKVLDCIKVHFRGCFVSSRMGYQATIQSSCLSTFLKAASNIQNSQNCSCPTHRCHTYGAALAEQDPPHDTQRNSKTGRRPTWSTCSDGEEQLPRSPSAHRWLLNLHCTWSILCGRKHKIALLCGDIMWMIFDILQTGWLLFCALMNV